MSSSSTVYMIDYGLAKRYKDPQTGVHIPYKDGKNLTGTARYASVNTHVGIGKVLITSIEQSRRDDLECIGYVLIYFIKGELPWQGLRARNKKDKYNQIKNKKQNTSLEELCSGIPSKILLTKIA